MYKCVNFGIYELVPRVLYESMIDPSILWRSFDERATKTLDALRKKYGKLIVNDWMWGGNNQYRGYRFKDCEIGAKYSEHKNWAAFDVVPAECTAYAMRSDFRRFGKNVPEEFKHIRRIEDRVLWFHFDLKETGKKEIVFFNP